MNYHNKRRCPKGAPVRKLRFTGSSYTVTIPWTVARVINPIARPYVRINFNHQAGCLELWPSKKG